MWSVLFFLWFRMCKSLKGFFDVSWHGKIDCAVDTVPVKGEAEEFGASPVGGDFVEVVETID